MSSYAQPSDFLAHYDVTILGDVVYDYGTRVSQTDLLTNPNLQAALDSASGLINSACLIGLRYAVTDLQALTGVDLALLVKLNCDIAFFNLVVRRNLPLSNYPHLQTAMDMLDRLRRGENIFNVPADVADGQVTAAFPSCVTVQMVNPMSNYAYRLFPVPRQQQVP